MKKIVPYSLYVAILLVLLYFDKVINLILKAINLAIAPIKCSGILFCAIGIILIVLFECLRQKYPILNPKVSKPSPSTTPLYSDQPTADDKYGRDIPATLLIEKIFSTFNDSQASKGSFVININEAYGFGKTSFLHIFEKQLMESSQPFLYIDYRPWLCENEQAIVKEFFTLLGERLKDYNLNDDITQYMAQLMEESSQVAPWWAKVPLSFIARNIKPRPLQEIHDDIRNALQAIDKPIIVTIDDVDRLQEKELTAVLKLIRDTADFPNIFYIVAAENAHLHQMLSRIGVQHPDIYLKKFFNLDFLLPAHETIQMSQLLEKLQGILPAYGYNAMQTQEVVNRIRNIQLIAKAFDNIRDVVRFLNAFTISLDMFVANNTLVNISPFDLFCLTLIKHLRPDVYKKLRDRNDEYLQIVPLGTDKCYQIYDNINIPKIREHKEALALVKGITNDNLSETKDKKEKVEEKELSLDETLEMSQVTYDDVVIMLLGIIFNSRNAIDNRSISRCNSYYLYFSGKTESSRLSYSDSMKMLQKPLAEYQQALDEVFKSNKDEAFINDFAYAFQQSGISKTEGMKKFNVFLRYRYKYKKYSSITIFENVTQFINWIAATEPFSDFLYTIYGNQNVKPHEKQKVENELREYCETEDDINMLLVAFSIFSQHLSLYIFSRQFVNEMLEKLVDRFMDKHLKNDDYPSEEDVFDTIILIKEEFNIRDEFNKRFIEYITDSLNRCKRWFGCIIIKYPDDDNIYWHHRHRNAVIGEYSNSGTQLINAAKQKFPECKDAFEELSNFQRLSSFRDMNLSNSKFIQMAREVQESFTDIG